MVADRYKTQLHAGNQHPLYYYRDNHQLEVDLVEKVGDTLRLTEVKSSTTYHSRLTSGLRKVASLVGSTPVKLRVVYGGSEQLVVDGVTFLPWNSVLRSAS